MSLSVRSNSRNSSCSFSGFLIQLPGHRKFVGFLNALTASSVCSPKYPSVRPGDSSCPPDQLQIPLAEAMSRFRGFSGIGVLRHKPGFAVTSGLSPLVPSGRSSSPGVSHGHGQLQLLPSLKSSRSAPSLSRRWLGRRGIPTPSARRPEFPRRWRFLVDQHNDGIGLAPSASTCTTRWPRLSSVNMIGFRRESDLRRFPTPPATNRPDCPADR